MQGTIIEPKRKNGFRKPAIQQSRISSTLQPTQSQSSYWDGDREIENKVENKIENKIEIEDDNSLKAQLKRLQDQHFTGRLDIEVQGQKWKLYLSLGRFAWASGGVHERRRWRRQLIRSGMTKRVQVKSSDRFECWDYELLILLSQKKLIDKERQISILRGMVTEILFEIVQAIKLASLSQSAASDRDHTGQESALEGNSESRDLPFTLTPRLGVRPSHGDTGIFPRDWTLEVELALVMAEKAWENWAKSGLALCSPNLAPILKNSAQLKEQVSPKTYQNLADLVTGKRTLRDLAILMKKDILGLTKLLLPYIRTQAIALIEVEDLPIPGASQGDRESPKQPKPNGDRGTILCIDDSAQIRTLMKTLLTNAGYRVITVGEAIQALPTLLECNPDAIFLDLMMPIANGYEICTQIRRIDRFKDIPIIILTGNDGLVDRVRAKMAGATDFLTKPIARDRILAAVSKYVQAKQ